MAQDSGEGDGAEFDLRELDALVSSSREGNDDPLLQSKREMLQAARNWLAATERAVRVL